MSSCQNSGHLSIDLNFQKMFFFFVFYWHFKIISSGPILHLANKYIHSRNRTFVKLIAVIIFGLFSLPTCPGLIIIFPTPSPFTNSELRNLSIDISVLRKARQSTDLVAPKLWKGWSGRSSPDRFFFGIVSLFLQISVNSILYKKIERNQGKKRQFGLLLWVNNWLFAQIKKRVGRVSSEIFTNFLTLHFIWSALSLLIGWFPDRTFWKL